MRRLRLLLVLVLVVALSPSLVSAPPAVAQSGSDLCDTAGVEQFTDVADGDYGAAYVLCMRALELSRGTGGGNYGPDRELNRAQMASFLVRLWRDVLGNDCPTEVATPFTDVDADSTHATNIECLYGLEITKGTSPSTYGPREPLKATQISRFLYRTYNKAGGDGCAGTDGSELDRATECLVHLRVTPTTAEAAATAAVTRAQMGVYVVGLWHNLTGRGLPPPPPLLGAATTVDQTAGAGQSTLRVAYTVDDGDDRGLWVVNADGTNLKRLTTNSPGSWWWSPNGARIAYSVDDGDDRELWVVDADGTNLSKLTTYHSGHPTWSPDGTKIAYSVWGGADAWGIWVVNPDGTNQKQLNTWGSDPEWSPDGARIAYTTVPGVWIMDADGTNQKQLNTSGWGSWWSPDGARVAYTSDPGVWDADPGVPGVWIADADGTNMKELTTEGGFHGWSPDGTKIAYSVFTHLEDSDDVEYGLRITDADGTNLTKLTTNGSFVGWSPDSARIVYRDRTIADSSTLWVADADGTNRKKLDHWPPVWSPDGTKMAYTRNDGGVWVADADGTNQKQLSPTGRLVSWSGGGWSPDGTKITYTSDGGVWVVDADGTNQKQLTTNGECPKWSPSTQPSRPGFVGECIRSISIS